MRRLVDVLIILGLGGVASIVAWSRVSEARDAMAVGTLAAEVHRFKAMIDLQSASHGTELNARGWPVTIDPEWFGKTPPRNNLVTPDRPWVEVALAEQSELLNPPIRMALDTGRAAFWYNPSQGVIRALVPMGTSDREALEMYNSVNGTKLASIYPTDTDRPLPVGVKPPETAGHPATEPPGKGAADAKPPAPADAKAPATPGDAARASAQPATNPSAKPSKPGSP